MSGGCLGDVWGYSPNLDIGLGGGFNFHVLGHKLKGFYYYFYLLTLPIYIRAFANILPLVLKEEYISNLFLKK